MQIKPLKLSPGWRQRPRLLLIPACLLVAALIVVSPSDGQYGVKNGEWRYINGDAGSTRYSELDQINEKNARDLRIAWTWKSENFGTRPDFNWEVTPLMVKGTLYFTAGSRRDVIAADAATGETKWMYRLEEGERGSRAVRSNSRGVAYWTDGKNDDRVVLITPGYQLVALNALNGQPIGQFGKGGIVDLWDGLNRTVRPGQIGSSSPAIVVRDVVIVGAALVAGNAPESKQNVPGFVRGYDVHTGKLLWTFHTIAQPGETGNDTWEKDSWSYTGNTAVWAPMSADEELGYVYLPVETPTGDYYGGHRPGNNLFAETLVCLDAKTGKRVWHFQFIHHGIWDWDIPTAPILVDVNHNGKRIKAVAQVTKQAFTYVFDRATGEPVWPIVERPVPQTDVPGEKTSPTQPFPTKPAAFDRQGVTEDDLIDLTPQLKAEALEIAKQYKLGPMFTPPIVFDPKGKKGTLMLPSPTGGSNWQGGAADPETGMLYVSSITNATSMGLIHDPKKSDMDYIAAGLGESRPAPGGERGNIGPQGLPLVKPPWGRITAIDLNSGEHAWVVANGDAPDYVKKSPALKGVDLSHAGKPERAPLMVTRTVLFAGDGSGQFAAPPGAGGPMFRVLNKKTGALIHEMQLPGRETGIPMTYMANGRQFVVVAVSAPGVPGELVALTAE
jgi:quinoprotein glucose dehydrogenase